MDQKKIERINFLARKSRSEGLTEAEKTEQQALRNEYRAAVIGNLRSTLERVEIKEPDGSITKIVPEKRS